MSLICSSQYFLFIPVDSYYIYIHNICSFIPIALSVQYMQAVKYYGDLYEMYRKNYCLK